MGELGVDVGGTFTDLAWWDGRRLHVGKTSSTPDQSDGVVSGSKQLLGGSSVTQLVHGTTVATNALLERDGVDVALVTSPGFEDVIEIGRQHRPSLYDTASERAHPLVDRDHRIGWTEGAADRLAALDPGAVAIALIGAFQDHGLEDSIEASLSGLNIPIVSSHQVTPEFREFERTSTTVVNAFLEPKVASYLAHLDDRVVPDLAARLMVMRSSGGLIAPRSAARLSASILLSGPAGGVVAAAALGRALGRRRVISFDMGGTSTDVCRIENGRPEVGYEREIDGLVVRMPSVAVHTVGAGGGSIGWADPGGALRVGPQSAGAHPGPASYGRGGVLPVVTDAHVQLGRLRGSLAGGVLLDVDAAHAALARLGEVFGLDPSQTALGMLEVVESTMERAVRAVSVEEGADPADAALVAFGGAGGLHATALARRLEMAAVVIPPFSGVFSAVGLLLAPPRSDVAATLLTDAFDRVKDIVGELIHAASRDLETSAGIPATEIDVVIDMRYSGQAHETSVPYRHGDTWDVLCRRFHDVHHERNGFSRSLDPVEVVTVRAAAVGSPALTWDDLPPHRPEGPDRLDSRVVTVGIGEAAQPMTVPVWRRSGLRPGDEVVGPCVVLDGEATAWLDSGDRGVLHESGALEVEW